MEQTLLPDGVSGVKALINNTQQNTLTSASIRAIDVSAKNNDKEINNANSQSESESRDQTNRQVPQAALQMRCNRSRGQAPLPSGGWMGVQESFGGRDGDNRTSLRRVGILECGGCFGCINHNGSSANRNSARTARAEFADPEVTAGGAGEQAQTPEQTTPIFFKMEWQRAVPKGQTRWHCNLCNKHFLAPADKTPETCPQGHKAS